MRHYSTKSMAESLVGLLGTDDLNDWETGFVAGVQQRLEDGTLTELTDRQVEALERLFKKHFA